MIPGMIAVILIVIFFAALYIVYRICFAEYRIPVEKELEKLMPEGKEYDGFQKVIKKGIHVVLDETDYEAVEVVSHDGLKLYGRYYHRADGAPLIIFMHGYHGNFYRDGNGIYSYSKKYGYNILLAHQRAHGISEGKTITFGVKERHDCKTWVEYAIKRFGAEQEILLSGLSMGAATVMMAADVGLPENVKGIMADCGYSSPKEILCSVMKGLHYPVKLMYPLARLSGKLFGHFDVEEASAVESLKNATVPVLFIHGEGDDFVPTYMSVDCHKVCSSEKELLLIPEAGHGMAYCYGPKEYEAAVDRFFVKTLGATPITHGETIS